MPNVRSHKSRGFPLIVWEEVCKPKFKRGLGIRRNEDVNKTSITKLGLRIFLDTNSIWVRIVREKYVRNNNFFNVLKKKRFHYLEES